MPTPAELIQQKEWLIDKIIQTPLLFTDNDFLQLVHLGTDEESKKPGVALNFADMRKMLIRIFDINETTLKQQSDATTGILGLLNKYSTRKRQKQYYKKMDSGFRDFNNGHKKVIVAEGDSWFQFPVFVKDIIDWLSDEQRYAVYSIAYGGDWFTNILYDEKYIEELSIHRPDVFLISGGGNDFVAANRLAAMVKMDCKSGHPAKSAFYKAFFDKETQKLKDQISSGSDHILPSFYAFLWTIKAQYYKLFWNLKESGKFDQMKIITQGYDYVIPTFERRTKKWLHLQPILNAAAGSGHWLKRPLLIQGIKPKDQCHIMKALIFELNFLFADLVEMRDADGNYLFKNVYHIDCRGTAKSPDDWWDEIHLHSEGFQRIAHAYKYCIDNTPGEKVIKVTGV